MFHQVQTLETETNKMKETVKQLKYQIAYDKILEMLKNFEIRDKLPSERKLAKEFNCTVFTVRNALNHLETQGIITRKHGSGTFLRSKATSNRKIYTAILIPPKSGAYGQRILESLLKKSGELNFNARTVWVKDFSQNTAEQLDELKEEGIQSIILPWIPSSEINNIPYLISKSKIPLTTAVCINGFENNYFELPQIIGLDIINTMEQVVEYLQTIGRKHIAILEPNMPSNTLLQNRFNAITRALAKHNLEVIFEAVDSSAKDIDQVTVNWKKYAGSLGVICYDDTMALRLLTSMHKNDLTAPKDFSVIGFNNIEQGLYSDPPLTTISQDFDHIAESMLKHSEGIINGKIIQSSSVNQHNLIIRESCGGKKTVSQNIIKQLSSNGLNIIIT